MAKRFETVSELYRRTQKGVAAPGAWQQFLTTACYNYRLPFDEQLLVFAQRPDATAVLDIDRWNRRFGRWVNYGAPGIAVIDKDHPGRLKYYFDVSDTHESRFSRPVPLWTVRPEYAMDIIEALENSTGELENKTHLATALISAAQNAVEDNMQDYLEELHRYKENSFLEELDELNIKVKFRNVVQNSVGYMLLTRCGLDAWTYFTDDDFRDITDFNTPEIINALGVATGDIAQMCLSEISRTVNNLERQAGKENRTFAPLGKTEYPILVEENTQPERSFGNERNELHDTGRVQDSESPADTGAGGTAWQIRTVEAELPEAAPARDLHESADQRQTEQSPDGDRADGAEADGGDHSADGPDPGRDGEIESHRSDEVGGYDEQHPSGSGGDGLERPDLQLTSEIAKNAGGDELPAFLNVQSIYGNTDQISLFAPQPTIEQPISDPSIYGKAEDSEPELPAEEEQTPAAMAPPKPRRERVLFSTLHPEIPAAQRHNYHISDMELGYGTRSEKYAANVTAIRLLKQIESEERLATSEEQEILSRYVGWGGLSDCFDERHGKYAELKALLTEDEYAAARESSLTAFYTAPVVIEAMYKALAQMGVQTGNFLEPACGVGNFMGMLPDSMADSKFYGVELDSISGRIAQQLYQNSNIAVSGFEKVDMPDSFVDVAIGNVPFGDFKVSDRQYDKHHCSEYLMKNYIGRFVCCLKQKWN